jgi:hypothetical protein
MDTHCDILLLTLWVGALGNRDDTTGDVPGHNDLVCINFVFFGKSNNSWVFANFFMTYANKLFSREVMATQKIWDDIPEGEYAMTMIPFFLQYSIRSF